MAPALHEEPEAAPLSRGLPHLGLPGLACTGQGGRTTSETSLTFHLGGDRQKQVLHGLVKSSEVTKSL